MKTHPNQPRFGIHLLAGPLAAVVLAAALGGPPACRAADAAPLNPFEQAAAAPAAAKPLTALNPLERSAQGAALNPLERAALGVGLNPLERVARGGAAAENPLERDARLVQEELARQIAARQEQERLELARQVAARQEQERLELARREEAALLADADSYAPAAISRQIPASEFYGSWPTLPTGDYTPGAAPPGSYQSGKAGLRASREQFEQSQARGWENMQREEKQLRDSTQRALDHMRNQAEQRRQQQQSDQRQQDIRRKFGR